MREGSVEQEEEGAIMEFFKDVLSILVCVGLSQAVAYPLGLDGSAALAMAVQARMRDAGREMMGGGV